MAWRSSRSWPTPTAREIIPRSRVLIIDDQEFPYKRLFEDERYNITKWNVVKNLCDLENGEFDLILLDLQGVAKKASAEDGIGILRHIRETSPHQLVIAFSSADFPLKYQPFFEMADGVLPKSADYGDFKKAVDDLLGARFRHGFYTDRLFDILGDSRVQVPKVAERFDRAVLDGDVTRLKNYLQRKLSDPDLVESVIALAQVAIKALSIWMS